MARLLSALLRLATLTLFLAHPAQCGPWQRRRQLSQLISHGTDAPDGDPTTTGGDDSPSRYYPELSLAGSLSQRFESIDNLNQAELKDIGSNLRHAIHLADIFFLVLIGWCALPISKIIFTTLFAKLRSCPFEESYSHLVASLLSQAAKLALVVLASDAVVIVLDTIGFAPFQHLTVYSRAFAKFLFLMWLTMRTCDMKRYLLGKAASKNPERLGKKLSVVNRFLDMAIYGSSAFFLIDILDVDIGVGLGSVFAMSSGFTLILGLAGQDAAKAFLSGLILSTSNRVDEGDEVRFGDGTAGFVQKIGWMQTIIRGYDNLTTYVPNSELGGKRVVNISRCKKCQVALKLRFKMAYADKMEKLCNDIAEEIKKACPEVIADGTKPLRVIWSDYKDDHLEVSVNTHYNLPPVGDKYWNNRKEVLKAINRAVSANEVEFQIRTCCCQPK